MTLIAVLTAVSTAQAVPKADASAVPFGIAGAPGKVLLYKTNAWAGAGLTGVNELGINGPDVYRTRGTRRTRAQARQTQRICVTLGLYKFLSSSPGEGPNPWVLTGQRRSCKSIAPGRYWKSQKNANLGGWHVYPVQTFASFGTIVRISWWSQSGRRLGKVLYKYAPGDYQCIDLDPGDINRCNVGPGPGGLAAVIFTY